MMSGTAGRLEIGPKPGGAGAEITRKLGYSLLYIVLIAVAVLQLFPLVWLLFFSLKIIRKCSTFLLYRCR